jgi:hypothetical protein
MRPFARFFLSALAALMLAATPPCASAGVQGRQAPGAICKHCPCGSSGCCVDASPSAPQPAPAVPSSHPAAEELAAALLARPVAFHLADLASAGASPVTGSASCPILSAVPLHARNCCFLI